MIIRKYKAGEEAEIWQVYFDTTHRINGREYTREQVNRWAPRETDMAEWRVRLKQKNPFVAECQGRLVGFAELDPDGHIDRFYCHHQWQRKGVGTLLYRAIEEEALRLGISFLNADVSTTAKAFFLRMGFHSVKEQQNVVCGEIARNYRMEKQLPDGASSGAGGSI